MLKDTRREAVERTAAKLRALHPEVPEEKWQGIVARSIVGAGLVLLGLVLLGGSAAVGGYLMIKGQTPSLLAFTALAVVFGSGLFLLVWGLVAAAGRLLRQPLQLVAATFDGVWRTIWRRGAPPAAP